MEFLKHLIFFRNETFWRDTVIYFFKPFWILVYKKRLIKNQIRKEFCIQKYFGYTLDSGSKTFLCLENLGSIKKKTEIIILIPRFKESFQMELCLSFICTMLTIGTSGRRSSWLAFGRSTGNYKRLATTNDIIFSFPVYSVVYFSYRRRAWIKKHI